MFLGAPIENGCNEDVRLNHFTEPPHTHEVEMKKMTAQILISVDVL